MYVIDCAIVFFLKNIHNEVWVYTEIVPLSVPYTGARASSPLSRVCCAILERSAERVLNLGITAASPN